MGLALASACGGDGAAPTDGDAGLSGDALFAQCQADPRGETYAPGLAHAGRKGALNVTLLSSDPGPPVRGNNVWVIDVRDAAGAPAADLTMTVTTFMPDHNHGSAVRPKITPGASPGQYRVDPVNLFMAGLWQITITVTNASQQPIDTVVFAFCVSS